MEWWTITKNSTHNRITEWKTQVTNAENGAKEIRSKEITTNQEGRKRNLQKESLRKSKQSRARKAKSVHPKDGIGKRKGKASQKGKGTKHYDDEEESRELG